MRAKPLDVVYEDNHLLVINKPAGLATQGVMEGTASVVTEAKEYLKRKYKKPGNVFLGVVSRLDAMVSGLLVLARTSKAAARLTEQFKAGSVEKLYWALVEGNAPPSGDLAHWLLKNDKARRIDVVAPRTRGAQQARLHCRVLGKRPLGTLVQIELHTGRKHQIRVQLADSGCPIVGDRKYGSRGAFAAGEAIALHCVRLAFDHPTTRARLQFAAAPPRYWKLPASDQPGEAD